MNKRDRDILYRLTLRCGIVATVAALEAIGFSLEDELRRRRICVAHSCVDCRWPGRREHHYSIDGDREK